MKKLLFSILLVLVGVADVFAQFNWEVIHTSDSTLSDEKIQYYFSGISCSDENNCTAIGNEYNQNIFPGSYSHLVIRTTDGGKSWVKQAEDLPKFSLFNDHQYRAIYAIDSLYIVACGDSGMILRTTNAGASWIKNTTRSIYNHRAVHFLDRNYGITVGTAGTTSITYNGGELWDTQEGLSPTIFNSCVSLDGGVGQINRYYASNEYDGQLFRYMQQPGSLTPSWDSVIMFNDPWDGIRGKLIKSIFFFDSLNGFAAGGHQGPENQSGVSFRAFIIQTTDGGETWTEQFDKTIHGSRELTSISFFDRKVGMTVTGHKYFLYTIDSGKTWREDSIVVEKPAGYISNLSLKGNVVYATVRNGFTAYLVKGTMLPGTSVISKEVEKKQLVISPNPASSKLILKVTSENAASIEVFDVLGNRMNPTINQSSQDAVVDVSNFPSGAYSLLIVTPSGYKLFSRFIKL